VTTLARVGWGGGAALAGGLGLLLAGAGGGAAGGAASGVRVVEQPMRVRVIVSLPGAGSFSAREGQAEATDPDPTDGRATVVVTAPRLNAASEQVTAHRVNVRVHARPGRAVIRVSGPSGRFKFLGYRPMAGPRLAIDLWIAAAGGFAATVRDDGCLRITRWSGGTARATARGLELKPLFEHGLVLELRGADGSSLGRTPITASEGTFKADFSGYLVPGRWSGAVEATGAGRVMLEAWVGSARDGSLQCLVQVPVRLAGTG
jgi:hypothetical protein